VPNRWVSSDYGIVSWWGHGNAQGAYVGYSSCSDGAFMLSSNAPSLDNTHPSHTYQCSCLNGYPEDSGNLQYAILKNGGITTTSATRVSWYYVGERSFATSPSNGGMGFEYVKRLVQDMAAGEALYNMKSSGVSDPGGSPEILMNFYVFCLYGDPSVGITAKAEILMPTVTNGAAESVTSTFARLNGEITDTGGENPTVRIYYGTSDGGEDERTVNGAWDSYVDLGLKGAETFYADISGLAPRTTYFYRCYASNSAGASWADSTAQFNTLTISSPSVNNGAAQSVTSTSARLNGELTDTGGENPTVRIYYGTDANNLVNYANLGTRAVGTFYADISGLAPGKTYFYRCYASNSAGASWAGSTAQFNTLAGISKPTVTNGVGATSIKSSSARLNGAITNTGGANPTVRIYWGLYNGGTNSANWQNVANLGTLGQGTFYKDISNLGSGRTYYYRCYASNSAGANWASSTASFRTTR